MTERYDEVLASNLDYISQTIRNRIIFQSEHDPNAIALWIVGTYLMDHWTRFPKLLVISPERECGKTTALEAIEGLVFKGKMASSITAAALVRCIEKDAPTVLIDEADLTLQDNKQLQAIINAGHTRRSAVRILSDESAGKKWEPKEMSLWCPQVIAGIGEFSDTLVSRSISIGLRRKGINEEIIYLDDNGEVRLYDGTSLYAQFKDDDVKEGKMPEGLKKYLDKKQGKKEDKEEVKEGSSYGITRGSGTPSGAMAAFGKAPRMQKGAMAYDGPNKERSEAADRVIAKTKSKRAKMKKEEVELGEMKMKMKVKPKNPKDMSKGVGQAAPVDYRTLAQSHVPVGNIFNEKMDPVGQEDKDIDNDGDHDSTDKYLANRRKAIGKAIAKKRGRVKEGFSAWRIELDFQEQVKK